MIVIAGSDHVTAHDASDGSLLWDYAGLNPNHEGMWRMIASPTLGDDSVVVPFGRGRFLANVRLGGSGDVTVSQSLKP